MWYLISGESRPCESSWSFVVVVVRVCGRLFLQERKEKDAASANFIKPAWSLKSTAGAFPCKLFLTAGNSDGCIHVAESHTTPLVLILDNCTRT